MDRKKKQKILCIHSGGRMLRGSEYSCIEILTGFKKRGRDVLLLCDQIVMLKAARSAGLNANQIPFGELMYDPPEIKFGVRVYSSNVAVMRYIQSFRANIVYCNGGRSCQNSLLSANMAKIPLVVHLRAPYNKRYHLLYGTPWASAVIHCSKSMQRHHESKVKFRKSYTVLNGIEFRSLSRGSGIQTERYIKLSPIPTDHVVLGFIGSIIPRKGIDILIDALSLLLKGGLKVSLLIGGKEESTDYREQVYNLHLEDNVHFLGEITDKVNFFSHVDIHILPSWSEGFGRTIVEAAFFGIPTVAHAVGGIPEAMCNGKFGELYSPNNALSLSNAIAKVIKGGHCHNSSGEIASKARTMFNISRVVEEILCIMDEL